MCRKRASSVYLHVLLLLLLCNTAFSVHWSVKTLPGYSGDLPFNFETGYIGLDDIEFFYYFVESEGNPATDPVLLYLNGSPGCSGLNGFFFQTGPLKFHITGYSGGLPSLVYESDTWTKVRYTNDGYRLTYATVKGAGHSPHEYKRKQVFEMFHRWIPYYPV